MKILIVNESDIKGGAARAAYRLHKALLVEGIDSQMLVQYKSSDDHTVIGSSSRAQKVTAKLRPIIDHIPVQFYKERTKSPFSPAWLPFSNIVKQINKLNPDIVHLHWINRGMIKIEDLSRIKAPIVWSLHDDWAFTGGCHIKWECENYKENCGNCPKLNSNKENDLSRKVFIRKQKTFSETQNIRFIGLSRWLETCAKESKLLNDKKIINLPNLIDTSKFKPYDKTLSAELWNLPKDKKLVLFSAVNATSDVNKGFKELNEALHKIKREDIELVVFGSNDSKELQNFGLKTNYLGNLHDDISLVTLYSAVDVMVVPSLQENLSNTIMESLSCGTPVVAFDVGGNSDMIKHKINGYLAKPFDMTDLANGINWVLNAPNYKELSQNARKKVLNEFDSILVIKKYLELYEDVLKNSIKLQY